MFHEKSRSNKNMLAFDIFHINDMKRRNNKLKFTHQKRNVTYNDSLFTNCNIINI